jgi:WhiB family transcriptional regulator, redox-sensing transcriptional regulator
MSRESLWGHAPVPRPDWRLAAACRQFDTELFFPIGTAGPAAGQIALAKAICQTCPVRTTCLDWAMRHHPQYGIWGGTTEQERRSLGIAAARRLLFAPASQ